jgi:hypothetical protein
MFRTAFNGIYEGNISVNARLFGNFFAGIGYQNSHFQNSKNVFETKIAIDPSGKTASLVAYNTRLDGHGGFIKIGYDKFFEKGYFSYVLNIGYMSCNYNRVIGDTSAANVPFVSQKFGAAYLQPELAVNFLTDGRLTFSILFSYATMFHNFDPKAPRFNHLAEINESKNKYFISWINIGFGFNVLLGKM